MYPDDNLKSTKIINFRAQKEDILLYRRKMALKIKDCLDKNIDEDIVNFDAILI